MVLIKNKKELNDWISNMKMTIDSESVNIYVDKGESDYIHVAYWYFEEWEEDAETVVPAMLTAIDLFNNNKELLLKTLGYIK
jgi:hypothetical protein